MAVRVTSREYAIFVRGKIFKTCKTEQEKDAVVARLKKDKTLTDKDIAVGLHLIVSK